MTVLHRAAHRAALATALILVLTIVLAACGGDADDARGLPTTDDLVADDLVPGDQEADDGHAGDDPTDERADDERAGGEQKGEEPNAGDERDAGDGGGAAGSCLAGDPDCTDESNGGQDMARPIPLDSSPSTAERIEPGATSGAAGRTVVAAHLLDDSTLELTFEGGACDLLEDVVVTETADEVRVLVLSGMDASVDVCTMQIVQWSTEVALDQPLGERELLDLSG